MDTKTLARGYGALPAADRFALATAAAAREDRVELARLDAATQYRTLRASDQFPYAMAFAQVAMTHWCDRLTLAATFFKFRHLAAAAGSRGDVAAGGARVFGYLLHTAAAGWELFCLRAGLDPAAGAGAEEWEATVAQAEAEAAARGLPGSAAEVEAEMDATVGPDSGRAEVRTPESVAAELLAQYREVLNTIGVG